MPQLNQANVDAVLSNISVAYSQDQTKFIANKVFPIVPVDKKSGIFMKYNREDWNRDEAQKRADITESAGSGFDVSRDTYNTDVYAFHMDVGDQALANAMTPFQPMQEATRFVAGRLLLRQEVDFATSFFKTGVWGTDYTGQTGTVTGITGSNFTQFDKYDTSDPMLVMEQAKELVATTTGYDVNTMVLGRKVLSVLKQHPDIIDRVKYTSSDLPDLQLIARLFGVERVFVGSSFRNTAKEGQGEALTQNYSNSILLTHTASSPGLLTPSAGYTFSWDGVSDGAGLSIGTRSWYMQELRATRVESESAWSNKVVAPDLGVFLNGVVA